jgi:shikimate 5-dehydrogenase
MGDRVMMNNGDEIKPQSSVYGFLAEQAQQNRFSVVMNTMFKSRGIDAMIIPMNIRPDDFFYTVSGLRNAKLQGVVIAPEFRHDVVELCDVKSRDVEACGFCDILTVRESQLYGDIFIGRAIVQLLKERDVSTLALYGSGALAKSILLHVNKSRVKKVILFNDRVESCMELIESVKKECEGIDIDIERASTQQRADFSGCDMAINVANQLVLFSEVTAAAVMVDFAKQGSPFSECKSEYLGYDDILPYLNTAANTIFEGRE